MHAKPLRPSPLLCRAVQIGAVQSERQFIFEAGFNAQSFCAGTGGLALTVSSPQPRQDEAGGSRVEVRFAQEGLP
jgi:hypothetical protein